MIGCVSAARFPAALATLHVVGGVDRSASRADIVFPDLLEPLPIADGLNPIEIDPKLDPMRHGGLKPLQVVAGIGFAFAAKVDAPFRCASGHPARLAIGQPLFRPAAVTPALLHRPILLRRKSLEPFGVLLGGQKP